MKTALEEFLDFLKKETVYYYDIINNENSYHSEDVLASKTAVNDLEKLLTRGDEFLQKEKRELSIVIKQQNSFILALIGCMKTNVFGQGIRESHEFKIDRGKDDSLMVFTRKDKEPIKPLDFFMFAWFAREYEE